MAVEALSPNTVYAFAALACAAAGAVSDIRWRHIPDWITGPGLVAGLLLHLALGDWRSLVGAALAAALAGGLFLLLCFSGAMSAESVKLMTAVCCVAGLDAVAQVLAGAALAAGLATLFVAAFRYRSKRRPANSGGLPESTPQSELNLTDSRALSWPCALAIAAGAASSVCNVFAR